MFKLSTVGLDTRFESHAPFFHCLVHDALIKSTPLFHKKLLQMIDIVYATSIHSLLKHTPDLVQNSGLYEPSTLQTALRCAARVETQQAMRARVVQHLGLLATVQMLLSRVIT